MITICSCLVGLVFVIGITKNAYVKKYEENSLLGKYGNIVNNIITFRISVIDTVWLPHMISNGHGL